MQISQTWVIVGAVGASAVLAAGVLAAMNPGHFLSSAAGSGPEEVAATSVPSSDADRLSASTGTGQHLAQATPISTMAQQNSDLGLPPTPTTTPTQSNAPGLPAGQPKLPNPAQLANAQPLGVGVVRYDTTKTRDWSDIDRWYKRRGQKRPAFTGEDRVHRFKSGNRQPTGSQPSLYSLLANGMVMENDPATPANVTVVAYHNITRMRGGAVSIDGVRHNQPLMGIHAPEVPGDRFVWLLPVDGNVAEFTFKAVSNQLIPDKAGEYEKLFVPAASGRPLLVTYKCHPAGSMAQRRVTRWELESAQWTSKKVNYVK